MYERRKLNYTILFTILLLAIISITTIYSAQTYIAKDAGNLALKQTIWYLIGSVLVIILIKYKNEYLYKNTWFLYIIGNLLLLGLLFFAPSINGSKCWFNIGGFSFQPSEFMKISLILVYSKVLGEFNRKRKIKLKDEILLLCKIFVILLIKKSFNFYFWL